MKLNKLRISEILKERNLTVKVVAEKMGITSVGLSQHINKKNPSVLVLQRIADAIGCEVWEFFIKPEEFQTLKCPHCGKDIRIEIKEYSIT